MTELSDIEPETMDLEADADLPFHRPGRKVSMPEIVDTLIHTESKDLRKVMREIRADLKESLPDLNSDDMALLRNILANAPAGLAKAHILDLLGIYDCVVKARNDLVTPADRDALIDGIRSSDVKVAGKAAICLRSVFEGHPDFIDSASIGAEVCTRIDSAQRSGKRHFIPLLATVIEKAPEPEFCTPGMGEKICSIFMDSSQESLIRKLACNALPAALSIYECGATRGLMREAAVSFPGIPGTAKILEAFSERIEEDLILDLFENFSSSPYFLASSRLAARILKARPDLLTDKLSEKLEEAFPHLEDVIYAYWGLPSLSELLRDTPALRDRVVERMISRLSSRDPADLVQCSEPGLRAVCFFPGGARELFRQAEGAIDTPYIEATVLSSFLEANFFRITHSFSDRLLSIYPSMATNSMAADSVPVTLSTVRGFFDRTGHPISEETISARLDRTLFDIHEGHIVIPLDLAGTAYRGGYEVETSSQYVTFSPGVALKNVLLGGEQIRKHQMAGRRGLWEISIPGCAELELSAVQDPNSVMGVIFHTPIDPRVRARFTPWEETPFLPLLRILLRKQGYEIGAVSQFMEALQRLSGVEVQVDIKDAEPLLDVMDSCHCYLASEENGWQAEHKARMLGSFEAALRRARQAIAHGNIQSASNDIAAETSGLAREYAYRAEIAQKIGIPYYRSIASSLPDDITAREPYPIPPPSKELAHLLWETLGGVLRRRSG